MHFFPFTKYLRQGRMTRYSDRQHPSRPQPGSDLHRPGYASDAGCPSASRCPSGSASGRGIFQPSLASGPVKNWAGTFNSACEGNCSPLGLAWYQYSALRSSEHVQILKLDHFGGTLLAISLEKIDTLRISI